MSNEPVEFLSEDLRPAKSEPLARKTRWKILITALILAIVIGSIGASRIGIGKTEHRVKMGWNYLLEDIELTESLSREMTIYADREFREVFERAGAEGWELVSIIPKPASSSGTTLRYKLVFKRPGPAYSIEPLGQEWHQLEAERSHRLDKALKAETKAQHEEFERRLQTTR